MFGSGPYMQDRHTFSSNFGTSWELKEAGCVAERHSNDRHGQKNASNPSIGHMLSHDSPYVTGPRARVWDSEVVALGETDTGCRSGGRILIIVGEAIGINIESSNNFPGSIFGFSRRRTIGYIG